MLHLRRLNLWPIRGFRCPCGEILLHAACMLRIRSPMVNWSDRLRLPRQSEHRQREGGPARLPSVFPAAGKRSAYKKSEGRINQDCHLKPKSLDQASFQISHFMMHDGRDFGLAHSSKVLLCRPPPSQPKSVKDDRPQPASTRRAPRRRRVIGLSELHSCCVTGFWSVGGTGARGTDPANERSDLDADSGQHPSLFEAIGQAPALALFSITRA